MSTSLESVPLKYRSSSDYLASLPPWRRLLARLNWHPVRETEIETWRLRIETERIRKETEQMRKENERIRKEDALLWKEDALLAKEDALLWKEDALLWKEDRRRRNEDELLERAWLRSRQLNAQIEALFCSDDFCSSQSRTTDGDSPPS